MVRKRRLRSCRFGLLLVGLATILTLTALFASVSAPKAADVEPGTGVRLGRDGAIQGTVIAFENRHSFGVGEPVPAFEIRANGADESVWVNARVVLAVAPPRG